MTARDDYPFIAMIAQHGPPYETVKRECERALTEIDDLRKRLEDAEAYIRFQEGITS